MKPELYWRSALGLFWLFIFFIVLSLVIGMTFLEKLASYPYAIFMSVILVIFLVAFLLFDKRVKAGFYLGIILSILFTANQAITLFFLLIDPSGILPTGTFSMIVGGEKAFFPFFTSVLLLIWGIFLFASTWKSRPVFEKRPEYSHLAWFQQLQQDEATPKQTQE